MADTKISVMNPASALTGTELIPVVQGGNNEYATPRQIAELAISHAVAQGRITGTTDVPVTTSDVLTITTLRYTPFSGDLIGLWDGTDWDLYRFSELTLAVPATTDTMYDLWAYVNAGAAALEALAWTNDTTRATALVKQHGVYVKSGALTRRYLGSFRTTGVSGQTEDSLAKRYLWNYYNRVARAMRVSEATASWNYSTASWRQVRATTTNQLDSVVGVAEDAITIHANATATSSTSTARAVLAGIGVNSTTANSAQILGQAAVSSVAAYCPYAIYSAVPAAGRTYYPWLEYGAATDTQTFYGSGSSNVQSAIFGTVMG